ncbi:hypothetical protein [Microvirga lenta]|uniref:hypothetical protein n=1 Tax=Microvirga lenta TaxID=2881337 RepID=UPI001CFFBD65|nr:hypothetical protein [Microvirga lenta]MCB5175219.1 hypothetical protein [Microvirga lenta]
MTQDSSDRTAQPQPEAARLQQIPAFKPVALPALAAAVHAVRQQPRHPKSQALPAILRKESALG